MKRDKEKKKKKRRKERGKRITKCQVNMKTNEVIVLRND